MAGASPSEVATLAGMAVEHAGHQRVLFFVVERDEDFSQFEPRHFQRTTDQERQALEHAAPPGWHCDVVP